MGRRLKPSISQVSPEDDLKELADACTRHPYRTQYLPFAVYTPTCVYRFFDADGHLLYVGMTWNPGRRWTNHRGSAPWWKRIAVVTVDWYKAEELARDAERFAIFMEDPIFNKSGKVAA